MGRTGTVGRALMPVTDLSLSASSVYESGDPAFALRLLRRAG